MRHLDTWKKDETVSWIQKSGSHIWTLLYHLLATPSLNSVQLKAIRSALDAQFLAPYVLFVRILVF